LLLLLQLRVTVREPKAKEVTKGRNSQTTSPPPLQCRKRPNPHKKSILFLCAKNPPKTGKKTEEPDLVQRRRREPIKSPHTQVCTDELDLNKKGTSPITPTSETLHGHTKKRTKKVEKKCKQKASKQERKKGTHNAETGSEAPPEEAGAAPASNSSTHFFWS